MSFISKILTSIETEDEKLKLYICKKNLDHIIIFCSLLTLMLTLNIALVDNTTQFINISIGLLIAYILIIGAGIYIQKKRSDSLMNQITFTIIFFIITFVWLVLAISSFDNIIQFYYYYIMILLMLSVFITVTPLINTIITFSISSVGLLFTLTIPEADLYYWLLIVALTLYSIASNHIRYNNCIQSFTLKEQIHEKNEILKILSNKDYLTNLYTNKYVFEQLEYEIARCIRYKFPMCTMFVDVDNFRDINDAYGQVVGDETLLTIGNVVSSMSRGTDIVGRYSGKKFIIILPNTNLEESIIAAERIRITIQSHQFPINHPVTVSIGLKVYDDNPINTFISDVDLLLQEAKMDGKNNLKY